MNFDEMVLPLLDNLQPGYVEEASHDDYFGQWVRGSEVVPCDVQHIGNIDG